MYPSMTFNIECVEEGGYFSGTMVITNGDVDYDGLTDDQENWKRLAESMMGWEFDEDED